MKYVYKDEDHKKQYFFFNEELWLCFTHLSELENHLTSEQLNSTEWHKVWRCCV
ncbi:MAG: hypothetical protein K5790_02325 [Nitrosopumilus sp.]|uniref:hypothetical protein n=1 Tax=Nitrosopumilus sp. TaxID=2024843 RepID=UPI00247E395F|nr:hypothetical protein [Nitrosopumilus sp.]MCV0392111.1 hypothetical protein [Nitrosopumilus sp.]